MDRFRIRHRPFSLTAWNASSCPQIGPSASHAPRSLELVENRTFPDAAPVQLLTRADIARVESNAGDQNLPLYAIAASCTTRYIVSRLWNKPACSTFLPKS